MIKNLSVRFHRNLFPSFSGKTNFHPVTGVKNRNSSLFFASRGCPRTIEQKYRRKIDGITAYRPEVKGAPAPRPDIGPGGAIEQIEVAPFCHHRQERATTLQQ